MTRRLFSRLLLALTLGALALTNVAHAEVSTVRLSHGFGILYLPLMIMRDQHLVEKHAKQMGLGDVKSEWSVIDGGNLINDAVLAGNIDVAGTGAAGFVTLWAKAHNVPRSAVIGLGAMSTGSVWLNTNNPNVKSLKDFTAKDKIALPGTKTTALAVLLEMAVAKTFGAENYARLDPMTVTLSHPEAVASLLSGKTEVTAHFASPPFSYQELKDPKIRRVLNSTEVLGPLTVNMVFASKRFADQNPKLVKAIMAAQEEANAYIQKDRKGAAEAYLRMSKIKLSQDEVEQVLADPDTRFSTAPNGIMQIAQFMKRTGTISITPAKWQDLFVADFAGREGS
ncbi:nitrate/sulfonate/bicarbonate ABC transporter periplasmic protein [Pandoraea terrae]|uniref:Nitrate/sulfonate/bicarbonate ABC transporter periplasmic protein n=1 Tax=Pandoraea terrae TaxID=1537710 RepID=A0A5E4VGV5_9BURK|nr:ABC transporter substrate-binding protein [Pandoraea terrae]VVE11276.1 nitrate/sulfonate/bicarbonate ABC transporter periplasmic protein [Pandoraea terrae]